jgi:hypothetical protein
VLFSRFTVAMTDETKPKTIARYCIAQLMARIHFCGLELARLRKDIASSSSSVGCCVLVWIVTVDFDGMERGLVLLGHLILILSCVVSFCWWF